MLEDERADAADDVATTKPGTTRRAKRDARKPAVTPNAPAASAAAAGAVDAMEPKHRAQAMAAASPAPATTATRMVTKAHAHGIQASGAGGHDDDDDDRKGRSNRRNEFGDGESGVQEIDTDSEVETIGGDGDDDNRSANGERADAGADTRADGEGSGEGRRRRRGRRGGRRGGRDRDQRDGEPSAPHAHDGAPARSSSSDLPIARPDEWLHSEPTVGDLAAEERRRSGGEDQPSYFSRTANDTERQPRREPEHAATRQHAGQPASQQSAGSSYPQVMAGAAALVVASEAHGGHGMAHEAASATGQSGVRVQRAPRPRLGTAVSRWALRWRLRTRIISPWTLRRHPSRIAAPAASRPSTPEPHRRRAESHRMVRIASTHVPDTGRRLCRGMHRSLPNQPPLLTPATEPAGSRWNLPPWLQIKAVEPAAPPEPPRPGRSGWWSKKPGE